MHSRRNYLNKHAVRTGNGIRLVADNKVVAVENGTRPGQIAHSSIIYRSSAGKAGLLQSAGAAVTVSTLRAKGRLPPPYSFEDIVERERVRVGGAKAIDCRWLTDPIRCGALAALLESKLVVDNGARCRSRQTPDT